MHRHTLPGGSLELREMPRKQREDQPSPVAHPTRLCAIDPTASSQRIRYPCVGGPAAWTWTRMAGPSNMIAARPGGRRHAGTRTGACRCPVVIRVGGGWRRGGEARAGSGAPSSAVLESFKSGTEGLPLVFHFTGRRRGARTMSRAVLKAILRSSESIVAQEKPPRTYVTTPSRRTDPEGRFRRARRRRGAATRPAARGRRRGFSPGRSDPRDTTRRAGPRESPRR